MSSVTKRHRVVSYKEQRQTEQKHGFQYYHFISLLVAVRVCGARYAPVAVFKSVRKSSIGKNVRSISFFVFVDREWQALWSIDVASVVTKTFADWVSRFVVMARKGSVREQIARVIILVLVKLIFDFTLFGYFHIVKLMFLHFQHTC